MDGTEQRLTLTGEGSIAHTLFTQPERISGGVPAQFLDLLDFMISFLPLHAVRHRACWAHHDAHQAGSPLVAG